MLVYVKYECFVMHMFFYMFVSCVHHVTLLNDAFCLNCSLFILV